MASENCFPLSLPSRFIIASGCHAMRNERLNNPITLTTFRQTARIAACAAPISPKMKNRLACVEKEPSQYPGTMGSVCRRTLLIPAASHSKAIRFRNPQRSTPAEATLAALCPTTAPSNPQWNPTTRTTQRAVDNITLPRLPTANNRFDPTKRVCSNNSSMTNEAGIVAAATAHAAFHRAKEGTKFTST